LFGGVVRDDLVTVFVPVRDGVADVRLLAGLLPDEEGKQLLTV
jgi:hypothetical protein